MELLKLVPAVAQVASLVKTFGSALNNKKIMTPEETEKARKQVRDTIIDMNASCDVLQRDIKRTLNMASRENISAKEKQSYYQRWCMLKQQLETITSMRDNLEMVRTRIEVAEMTVAFGDAIKSATATLRECSKNQPDYKRLRKEYERVMKDVNYSIDPEYEKLTNAVMNTGNAAYSTSEFEKAMATTKGMPEMQRSAAQQIIDKVEKVERVEDDEPVQEDAQPVVNHQPDELDEAYERMERLLKGE